MQRKIMLCIFIICIVALYSQEQTTNPSKEPNIALSSNGRLRFYEADNERITVGKNNSSIVLSDGERFEQKQYDERQRLVKEVSWSLKNNALDYVKVYSYIENSAYVQKKDTDNFSKMERIIEYYNPDGKVEKEHVYALYEIVQNKTEISENTDENSTADSLESSEEKTEQSTEEETAIEPITYIELDEEQTILLYTKDFTYDNSQRLIKEVTTYNDKTKENERIEYEFKKGESKADEYVYSNNDLKKSTIFSSPIDWIDTVYFSPKSYFKTVYINNSATVEEFYENDIKIRERTR